MPAVLSRWYTKRTPIWIALSLLLVVWGFTDVRNRGRYDPARPLNHMTDLTVYTEAAAAFFDGRDPYTVSNPRGWHYLYPPLFAIALAPLSKLDSQWQVVIWYFFNLAVAWGCCYESLRLLRLLRPPLSDEDGDPKTMGATAGSSSSARRANSPHCWTSQQWRTASAWLVGFAAAAMLFPTLNCLQRGQVGLLITYLALLGLRLSLGSRSWIGWSAGGIVLALAIAIKLTPIMPALFLAAMLGLPAVIGWNRRTLAPATALFGGMLAGLVLFLLLLPSAAVGWSANLHHLERWVDLIVLNHDVGGENDLTYHSVRNQSLTNAVYRLGNWAAFAWDGGPSDLEKEPPGNSMPMDRPIVHRVLVVVRFGLLALLAAVGWLAARRGAAIDLAAAFGAACIATLLISPLSWAHHYLIAAPGFLFVPLWYWQQGRLRLAKTLAMSACGLLCAHYLFLDWAGRAGLLGLGTTVWFLIAAIGMMRHSAAENLSASTADRNRRKPGAELRAA